LKYLINLLILITNIFFYVKKYTSHTANTNDAKKLQTNAI